MAGIMNVGVRALMANQAALQTVGHNIANVNTPGYSRQSVTLQDVAGQFSGSGYFGNGVEVTAVARSYSDFLTRQAALAKSVAAADSARQDSLRQLENIFQGGPDGLGTSISNMLNAFSDVVNAPTDLTARSVVLARADEMAARFRTTASQLNDLKVGVTSQLSTDLATVNSLAQQIARANDAIARASGGGQSPNDLLDQRTQLISELNQYVQTTEIPATDGSLGVFLASGQPLVLGTSVSPLKIAKDDFGDPDKSKLTLGTGSGAATIDEAMLGGGEVAGLLRFQNQDLVEASNLLGRMALAIGSKMNEQQGLGLTLNGQAGSALFSFKPAPTGLAAASNAVPGTSLAVSVQTGPTSGAAVLVASDYELNFSSATAGSITRRSDGVVTAFDFNTTNPLQIDGLTIQKSATAATAGDRFLVKPFSAAATAFSTAFSSPRDLAMASPAAATAAPTNQGTLTLAHLAVRSAPVPAPVTLTFTGPGTYTRSDDTGAPPTAYSYTPGQPIEYSTALALTGWSLTLKGSPQTGDSYTVKANPYPTLNADNAQAMLDLRDAPLFDGAPLTDGYASLMTDIGVKVQSAKSASAVSSRIATSLEKDRASVSGVNLDEEAAKLLQYQQAYQASGKMLQIAQNVFDTLLQTLGR